MNHHPDQTPDKTLLHWLDSSDTAIIAVLVKNYLLLSTERSEDFALDDAEALTYVKQQISRPDFPQRRVARLLIIRSLFSFLLDQDRLMFVPQQETVLPIQTAHLLQVQRQWKELCENDLADSALIQWLEEME